MVTLKGMGAQGRKGKRENKPSFYHLTFEAHKFIISSKTVKKCLKWKAHNVQRRTVELLWQKVVGGVVGRARAALLLPHPRRLGVSPIRSLHWDTTGLAQSFYFLAGKLKPREPGSPSLGLSFHRTYPGRAKCTPQKKQYTQSF